MNNNQPCLMIRCIILEYDKVELILLEALQERLRQFWPMAHVSLRFSETYWKFPECKEIIYNFSHELCILVRELISKFDITWMYNEEEGMLPEGGVQQIDESAVWNKHCYPAETFVHPKLEWVEIYTWPEDAPE